MPLETTAIDPRGDEMQGLDQALKGRRGWGRWGLLGLVAVVIAGFYFTGLHRELGWESIRGRIDGLQSQVGRNPALAAGLFFLTYVGVTALSLPVAAGLSLAAGALFGRLVGTGVVLLGATVGATLAMLSARYVLRGWVQRKFGHRLEPINRGVERDGPYYLFTLRLVPVIPFFLINLGMGLTRMRALPYALVSLVGMLPGSLLYVHAGTELGRIDHPSEVISGRVLVALGLLGIAPLAMRLLVKYKNRIRLGWGRDEHDGGVEA